MNHIYPYDSPPHPSPKKAFFRKGFVAPAFFTGSVVLITGVTYFLIRPYIVNPKNFEECETLVGSKILESYPPVCMTKRGQAFTKELRDINQEKLGSPIISFPEIDKKVSYPIEVKGTAPAGWLFEGSTSLKLLDKSGELIAQTTALEDSPGAWMSGESVNFSATFDIEKPDSPYGYLILEKANPSGLPENYDLFDIPVIY